MQTRLIYHINRSYQYTRFQLLKCCGKMRKYRDFTALKSRGYVYIYKTRAERGKGCICSIHTKLLKIPSISIVFTTLSSQLPKIAHFDIEFDKTLVNQSILTISIICKITHLAIKHPIQPRKLNNIRT